MRKLEKSHCEIMSKKLHETHLTCFDSSDHLSGTLGVKTIFWSDTTNMFGKTER